MSGIQLDTPLAEALSNVVHAKITESGWSQEDDTSLAEYIVLMLVNGKTRAQIASELQSDLLPDVDGIPEFTKWLLNQVDILRKGNSVDNAKSSHSAQDVGSHPVQVYPTQEVDMPAGGGADEIPAAYDADMGDSAPDNAPKGPKGLQSGRGTGRGGRMMTHMNKAMDRSAEAGLHRVRNQSGTERISTHVRGVPKGPRNVQNREVKPGMQKALNGMNMSPVAHSPQNTMMSNGQQGQPMMSMTPQQQMEFMAVMEQQARMMAQFMPGMVQPAVNPAFQQPGTQQNGQGKSLFDRVESGRGRGGRGRGRGGFQSGPPRNGSMSQNEPSVESAGGTDPKTEETPSSSMEVEQSSQPSKLGDPTTTMCRFNLRCINKDCPYVHQSPAAAEGTAVDMNNACTFGVTCKNTKCVGKHPSPALIKAHQSQELCKFFPNCSNPNCGFKHPTTPLCRNGGDCKIEGCIFTHLQTPCRFKPCLNARCPYKHEEGQRGGAAASHVWTKDQPSQPQSQEHVSERKFVTEGEEELIKPEPEQGEEASSSVGPGAAEAVAT